MPDNLQLADAVVAFAKKIESSVELQEFQTASNLRGGEKWLNRHFADGPRLLQSIDNFLWDCPATKNEISRCCQSFAQVNDPNFHSNLVVDLRRLATEIRNPKRLERGEVDAGGRTKLIDILMLYTSGCDGGMAGWPNIGLAKRQLGIWNNTHKDLRAALLLESNSDCAAANQWLNEMMSEEQKSQTTEAPPSSGKLDLKFIKQIGQGQSAHIWLAEEPALDRKLAIRLLIGSGETEKRTVEHARALAKVNHPNVVVVHRLAKVQHPDHNAIVDAVVLEYLDGKTLFERQNEGKLTAAEVTLIGESIINGLEHIHSQGLEHGDLHEGNVMVCSKNVVKVLDIAFSNPNNAVSTETRDIRLRRDVDSLKVILSSLLVRSELDAGTFPMHLRELFKAEKLADVRNSFNAILKCTPPGTSTGERQTPPDLTNLLVKADATLDALQQIPKKDLTRNISQVLATDCNALRALAASGLPQDCEKYLPPEIPFVEYAGGSVEPRASVADALTFTLQIRKLIAAHRVPI